MKYYISLCVAVVAVMFATPNDARAYDCYYPPPSVVYHSPPVYYAPPAYDPSTAYYAAQIYYRSPPRYAPAYSRFGPRYSARFRSGYRGPSVRFYYGSGRRGFSRW